MRHDLFIFITLFFVARTLLRIVFFGPERKGYKKLFRNIKNSSTMISDWIRDCYYAINSWQENSLRAPLQQTEKKSFDVCDAVLSTAQTKCRKIDSLWQLNNFIFMSSNLEYHSRHYKLHAWNCSINLFILAFSFSLASSPTIRMPLVFAAAVVVLRCDYCVCGGK